MNTVTNLAMEASQQGWLRFKESGSVIEISFPGLLTVAGEKAAYEPN
jgi:hypothetical protein